MSLTPKNWASFQHYKDRAPAWIKLHRGLLDNHEFHRLSDSAGKMLPLLWLLASEKDGLLPEPEEVAFRLRVDAEKVRVGLQELVEGGFLIEIDTGDLGQVEHDATPAQRVALSNGFGKRHISDEVKRRVWKRDKGKCRFCGSGENIEYDHKVPVSKGGNSDEENIQLLCRPCNRKKRTQVLRGGLGQRSLEREEEEEKKEPSQEEGLSKGTYVPPLRVVDGGAQ